LKKSTIIILLFIFISCDKKNQLDGHWHINSSSDDLELISVDEYEYPIHLSTLDIKNAFGVTNQSSQFLPKSKVKNNHWRNEITLSTKYSKPTIFKYTLKNDSLFFTDKQYKINYIGHRVNEENCDLDKSYFNRHNLDLKTPIISDSIKLEDIKKELGNSNLILIGKPKELGCFGPDLNFIIDGKFGSIQDLESSINFISQKETNIIKIYADKRINISFIKETLLILQKTKHHKIYFALKNNDQKNVKWINSKTLFELVSKSAPLSSKVSLEKNTIILNDDYSWTYGLISTQG